MTTLEWTLFIVPSLVAVGLLAYFAWRHEMFGRKQRLARLALEKRIAEARLDTGRVLLYTQGLPRTLANDLVGYFMLVAVGSFGVNQTVRFLTLIYQCGLENLVGSVFIIEHNASVRQKVYERTPPIFHER